MLFAYIGKRGDMSRGLAAGAPACWSVRHPAGSPVYPSVSSHKGVDTCGCVASERNTAPARVVNESVHSSGVQKQDSLIPMPKYHVNFQVEGIVSVEIEAASKEEARQAAYRLVIDNTVPVTVLEVTGSPCLRSPVRIPTSMSHQRPRSPEREMPPSFSEDSRQAQHRSILPLTGRT